VPRGKWRAGDLCVFIEPDSVLPDAPWATFYKARSNRVKAIKLRGVFSFGIVEDPVNVGYTGPLTPGLDITAVLGIVKYEAPAPQDLSASGPYGFGIPKTDEERWQSVDDLPYGQSVDVALKIDGQSFSAFCAISHVSPGVLDVSRGVGGRSFLYKETSDNHYIRNERRYGVLAKLERFCRDNEGVSLCVRGEQYGQGIQTKAHNPHSKLPVGLALFSTWLIDERRYATKGHPLYIHRLAPQLGLPTVPMIQQDVILTPELVKRYSEELETIDGQPFEGVVINHAGGSFKVINLHYDARK
jgi:RNA ligase (TIGR02306 family)